MNGQTINDIIHFAAHAFPTNHGDPVIDHVNFTAGWNGTWRSLVSFIQTTSMIHFNATLASNGLMRLRPYSGEFDVYDKMGNVNKAPSGNTLLLRAQWKPMRR